MAIEYGITTAGFVIKTLDILKQETDEDLIGIIGNQVNLLPESAYGQIRDKFSERFHELWELFQQLYNANYPQTAEDVSLDNVCDFAAIERLNARASTITEQVFFGTVSTVIAADTRISVENDSTTIFKTDTEVTLVAGTDEIQTIGFSGVPGTGAFSLEFKGDYTGAIVYTAVAADVQTALRALDGLSEVTVSGSFATDFIVTFTGNDGTQEQPLLIESTNTLSVVITITETTPGEYQGTTTMTCTETGPSTANIYKLNVIDNPISGLISTFNTSDAVVGRDIETNAELRIRRNESVVISRAATVEAIRNKILDLNGDAYSDLAQLTDVIVYENDTDTPNFYGRNIESHTILCVIRQAGDVDTRDQEIAQAIFDSKAAGIGTSHGHATGLDAVTKTVEDSTGVNHTIKFTRPDEVPIYLGLYDFVTNSSYPVDGDTQLKTILAAWGNTLGVGVDIIVYPQLVAQINGVPGITDFVIRVDTSAISVTSTDDNITISDGTSTAPEYSNWSTADITISAGSPP